MWALPHLSRRAFVRLASGVVAGAALGCRAGQIPAPEPPIIDARGRRRLHQKGRLSTRPSDSGNHQPMTSGLISLGLGPDRDGAIYVPAAYRPPVRMPLVVMLHGAQGSGRRALRRLQPLADQTGLILLAPDSRDVTWDVVRSGFGPDVEFLDRALDLAFARYAVDPSRVAIEGFSDGASYALSLGLRNGDLFSHVIAFSPGFLVSGPRHGSPRFFVAHGTADEVLPIERCGRRLARDLRRQRYAVDYREFDGGHTVPAAIAREAVAWFRH